MTDITLTDGVLGDEDQTNTPKTIAKQEIPHISGRGAAVLRVNRRVYFEAVPILYPVTALVALENARWQIKSVQPRIHRYRTLFHHQDTFERFSPRCIDDTPRPPATTRALRMSDLFSFTYYDRALDNCDRLDRLAIEISLDFMARLPGYWRILGLPDVTDPWEYHGADATLDSDSEKWVIRRIRQDSSIKAFVEKIQKVSWVAHLDLDFYIDTTPPVSQRVDVEAEDFEERQKIWRKGDMNVANIFLATGILDPLQELNNVGSWCIELTVRDQTRMKSLAHERMELDLTGVIRRKS